MDQIVKITINKIREAYKKLELKAVKSFNDRGYYEEMSPLYLGWINPVLIFKRDLEQKREIAITDFIISYRKDMAFKKAYLDLKVISKSNS